MVTSNSIKFAMVLIAAVVLAIFLGVSVVTDQAETLIKIIVAIGVIVCISLRSKIWLVVPFAAALNITIMIPTMPTSETAGQIIFLGFALLIALMKKLPVSFKFTEYHFWVIATMLCVIQSYSRNPVGLNVLGGDTVGGRPYVILLITLISSLLLSVMKVSLGDLKLLFRTMIWASVFSFIIKLVGQYVPQIGVYYGVGGILEDQGAIGAATRIGFLGQLASNIATILCCALPLTKSLFNPFISLPLIFCSFVAAAMSGYRNSVGGVGLIYMFGLVYRQGKASLLVAILAGLMGLGLLIVVNEAAPLPANMQRAFTFLPGNWGKQHREDAEGSTDWRKEMWIAALTSDRWIRNKIFGDGLGISRQDYNWMQALKYNRLGSNKSLDGLTDSQVSFMLGGAYHSGPVSTIRTVGYVGLFVYLIAMIRMMVICHKLIVRCKAAGWFSLSLCVSMPVLFGVVFWWFIFGDFQGAVSLICYSGGLINLTKCNLVRYGIIEDF